MDRVIGTHVPWAWDGGGQLGDQGSELDLLSHVPLFAGCKPADLQRISQLADEVDVPDGYRLIREGDFGQEPP